MYHKDTRQSKFTIFNVDAVCVKECKTFMISWIDKKKRMRNLNPKIFLKKIGPKNQRRGMQ